MTGFFFLPSITAVPTTTKAVKAATATTTSVATATPTAVGATAGATTTKATKITNKKYQQQQATANDNY